MALKSATYQFKGMNRDLSNMNASKDYAYEIRNMKITANKDNTLFSISSVKGSKETSINIKGTPIGHCTINDLWVIFTKGTLGWSEAPDINILEDTNTELEYRVLYSEEIQVPTYDYIYLISNDNNNIQEKHVCGNLNFSIENPIEAISFVENEEIKKIYWTDGLNLPRFITTKAILEYDEIKSSDVDFIPEIKSSNNEIVTISKNENTIGMFPAGTTLYAFSYINYYGQLSNIFHVSSIYYNVSNNKALEANKTSFDSYKITINNLNNNDYQYVRIYSIVRTSQDSTPEVRVVTDYKLKEDGILEYTDRHTTGYTIDPTELFYIGGELLVIGTMALKDNTLFIGDITLKKEVLPENIVDQFNGTKVLFKLDNNKYITEYAGDKYYADLFRIKNTPSNGITTFKTGDYYRFGVQLMHKSGRWSEPVYIGDYLNNTKIRSDFNIDSLGNKISHFNQLVSAEAIIDDSTLLLDIKNLGYVKIRPVVVYPEFVDRSVLCLGYLSPTVYNAGERLNGGTYVQSSWFARPYSGLIDYDPTSNYQDGEAEDQHGALLEFRHNAYIGGKYTRHQEIQGANKVSFYDNNEGFSFVVPSSIDINTWKKEHSHQFFIDSSIVTMHSPEFEFDNSFKTLDLDSYKFRIVGFVPLTSHLGNIDIITSKGARGKLKNSWIGFPGYDFVGFYKNIKSKVNYSKYGGHLLCSGVFYRDFYTYNSNKDIQVPEYTDYTLTVLKYPDDPYQKHYVSESAPMGYHIFPFHCSGNITNNPEEDDNYNTLLYKRLSNVRYSYGNIYKDILELLDIPINSSKLFYSDQSLLLRINNYNNEQVFYSGNIDTVITPKLLDNDQELKNGSYRRESPLVGVFILGSHIAYRSLNLQQVNVLPYMLANEGSIQTDPIIMRYKSTPHAVISFKGDVNTQNILPTINNKNPYGIKVWEGSKPFWQHSESSYIKYLDPLYNFSDNISEYTGLWLAELYLDIKEDGIFGGTSTQAIANNKWNIAGEEVILNTSSVELKYTEGDTYYQRYDNLKTYPWSMEEVNGITDVISFMVETRINLEGRYDSNKADKPHFHILPSNFNLINKAYTQKNNFFEYYGVDYDRVEVNKYPNLISWSKTKTAGELTDTWLNLNLSSTLDLDGNCGKITSLLNYNGLIFAFLEKAINQILYNELTQISTTAGVPIEIANSGKVTGYRNYSNQVGCSNKWSICLTPNGLYFLDSFNKDLYKIGESLNNLSSTNGFNTYLRSISNIEKPWNPRDKYSIKTSYDPINKEVLFSTNKETLSYSELLLSFMSFYDFKAEYMSTLNGNTLILGETEFNKNGVTTTPVYKYQEGLYNYLYGKQVPYYVEFIANPDPLNDKIFNVLEFRSDSWDNHNYITHSNTFNKLTISNEYLNVSSTLELDKNLKKRFRIWKALIPREPRNGSPLLNRIRNTWAKIKLESTKNNENLNTVLHDITVHYSV